MKKESLSPSSCANVMVMESFCRFSLYRTRLEYPKYSRMNRNT